jgi:hypothetical protein
VRRSARRGHHSLILIAHREQFSPT